MTHRPSRPLDLDAWPRRAHFELFRDYDQPFFGLTAEVEVSRALAASRRPGGPSFFVATLWLSIEAANAVEAFRYRVRDEGVAVFETVDGGSTILRDDGTFGFGYFDRDPDFDAFAAAAAEEVARVRRAGSPLEPRDDRDDLLHHTVVPWIAFTSIRHARRRNPADSVPKIAFGRFHGPAGEERMPVSVEAHHALMDALHVGRYLDALQRGLDAFDR